MIKRFGRREGLVSLVVPSIFYLSLAAMIFFSIWPYFYYVKNETLIVLGLFALWRYSWLLLNYIRAALYSLYRFPRLRKIAFSQQEAGKYPEHIYFVIASYNEEPWVSVEMLHSVMSNVANLPCEATLIIATGSDKDDAVLAKIYDAHPVKDKVNLVFQRQSSGKRIALGHALRAVARRYKDEPNSVTVFMDGDSYLENATLEKCLPYFSAFSDLGALTTNEVAYVNTRSQWYKDWFNLKFGQRHMLFQSHALSNKVLTLTGRFSMFRTSVVVTEEFIERVENDSITHWHHGKFRFLMGDDKSTWFHLLKDQWSMLYIPDVKVYSLESRDANFWELTVSLPYRWNGNTLRNNSRALALGPEVTGWFIWFAILDQRLTMWTSLVGITGAVLLAIMKSFVYLPFYIMWVIGIRLVQTTVIALMGHPVSVLTIPLMLYNQWMGAIVKIRSFYNLSEQRWSKRGTQNTRDESRILVNPRMARILGPIMHYGSYVLFLFVIIAAHGFIDIPPVWAVKETARDRMILIQANEHGVVANDGKSDSEALQALFEQLPPDGIVEVTLPSGELNFTTPVVLRRSYVIVKGQPDTRIVATLNSEQPASVLRVSGERIDKTHRGSVVSGKQQFLTLENADDFSPGDIISMTAENDSAFLAQLGSKNWQRDYPHVRRMLNQIVAIKDGVAELYYPVDESLISASILVKPVKAVSYVELRNLTIEYRVPGRNIADVNGVYENAFPTHANDSLTLQWTTNVSLDNITLLNAGSSPLSVENSLACQITDLVAHNAWNKGKDGNGYIRFSKSHYCDVNRANVDGIRHIVFQWGASNNVIRNLYTTVDVNFHGGYAHDNQVYGLSERPETHPWPKVYRTPDDAHWAPPDGKGNIAELKQVMQ